MLMRERPEKVFSNQKYNVQKDNYWLVRFYITEKNTDVITQNRTVISLSGFSCLYLVRKRLHQNRREQLLVNAFVSGVYNIP